ncbi:DeoR-like helix-turn-helix domain [Rothia kristinae]|nr:DeoR family transcriptional regulator [Rothia kristinae]SQC36970.1 DeoR-like helix-turn-helix domain [Rothia kristinae]
MQRSHRQKMIIEAVRSGGEVSVVGLVRLTGASPITVRRDLAQLQDLG